MTKEYLMVLLLKKLLELTLLVPYWILFYKRHWVCFSPPSRAMMLKFLWHSKFYPSLNSLLIPLNYNMLKIVKEQTEYFAQQELSPNGEGEKELLEKSSLHTFPHEVWQIRIKTFQKVIIKGDINHGGLCFAANLKQLKCAVGHLALTVRQKGLSISEIEIVHTHPSLELLIIEPWGQAFVFNGLGERDKYCARRLAEFMDYPLRICAVTPAVNYSMVF